MKIIVINDKKYYYDKLNRGFFLQSIANDFYDIYPEDFDDFIVSEYDSETIKLKTDKGTVPLSISGDYLKKWERLIKKIRKGDFVKNTTTLDNSQSKQLRENKKQHKVKNDKSKKQEKKIKIVSEKVRLEMMKRYPDKQFILDSTFMLKPLIDSLKEKYPDYPFFDQLKDKTHIRPDGGLLSWVDGDDKHIILISEQKQQGTNDSRIFEGLESQAKGNTIERTASPFVATMLIFCEEEINPYVVWCQGCDFHPTSTIFDRGVRTFALQKPNQINLFKKTIGDMKIGGSIFMYGNEINEPIRFEWDEEFMFDVMLEIADKSMQYYLTKYGK